MKIGVLTSSRADFGIYLPLLKRFKKEPSIEFEIIAFGTHLSFFHGYTVNDIKNHGFEVKFKLETLVLGDSEEAIASSMGLTTIKFATFWAHTNRDFDIVFCLGDRYEMFAAVCAGIPFNINFAHIHGGETTLGSIDNTFRHCITLASNFHFVATEVFADKVAQVTGSKQNIYNIGALSLDNIEDINLLSIEEFKDKWGVDFTKRTILFTFHPETVENEKNEAFIVQLVNALDALKNYQVLVTMPNADTAGGIVRTHLLKSFMDSDRIFLIENLGSQDYFTAMAYCSFLLGNSSSGIIEAASFGKYVINVGDRQKGRVCGKNVIQIAINAEAIESAVGIVNAKNPYSENNVYYRAGAADKIINVLKEVFHG